MKQIIQKNISRHYKRLEQRLKEISAPIVVLETISKEFRFLERDLLSELESQENRACQPENKEQQ
jgi:hypothetical protein